MDLPFPRYAQACEHALFGRPTGAPYEAPGADLSRELSAVADLDEDEDELRQMRSGSTIHSKTRYIDIPGVGARSPLRKRMGTAAARRPAHQQHPHNLRNVAPMFRASNRVALL